MADDSPKDDELAGTEQPFVQHLMELRDRLVKAMIAIGVATAVLAIYPGPAELYDLLEKANIMNVLVDTAGRRDLMHMRLTTPSAFVRWVGANHESDRARLDEWVERVADWKKQGLSELYFFVHQNVEKESPLLGAYFIEKLNKKIATSLPIPKTLV